MSSQNNQQGLFLNTQGQTSNLFGGITGQGTTNANLFGQTQNQTSQSAGFSLQSNTSAPQQVAAQSSTANIFGMSGPNQNIFGNNNLSSGATATAQPSQQQQPTQTNNNIFQNLANTTPITNQTGQGSLNLSQQPQGQQQTQTNNNNLTSLFSISNSNQPPQTTQPNTNQQNVTNQSVTGLFNAPASVGEGTAIRTGTGGDTGLGNGQNTGLGNTGLGNTGLGNTGLGNTGLGNTGLGNTGLGNTGLGNGLFGNGQITGLGNGQTTGLGNGQNTGLGNGQNTGLGNGLSIGLGIGQGAATSGGLFGQQPSNTLTNQNNNNSSTNLQNPTAAPLISNTQQTTAQTSSQAQPTQISTSPLTTSNNLLFNANNQTSVQPQQQQQQQQQQQPNQSSNSDWIKQPTAKATTTQQTNINQSAPSNVQNGTQPTQQLLSNSQQPQQQTQPQQQATQQQISQSQTQPVQPSSTSVQPQQKLQLPNEKNSDFFKIMEILNCKDDIRIQTLFREDKNLYEIMLKGSDWFSFSDNKVQLQTDSPFDQEIRTKCFDNKIKSEVYQVLKRSLQQSRLKILENKFERKQKAPEKSKFFETEIKKFQHIIFNHYAEQRSQLVAGLKLMLVNLINEEEIGNPSKQLNDMFKRGLIEGLANSFLSVPKALNFYLKQEQYSEEYTFQTLQHFVSEQTQILEIFTILQCYFKIDRFEDLYVKPVQKLIENMKQTQFLGLFHKNEHLIFQEYSPLASKLQDEYKKIAFAFILALCIRPLYQEREADFEDLLPPLWISKIETIKQIQPDYMQKIFLNAINLQEGKDLQNQNDYQSSLRYFEEVLRVLENASINTHFWNCVCTCIYQWIRLYKIKYQDDEYDDEGELLSKIFSILLQLPQLWFLFCDFIKENDSAEKIISERLNKLKVFRKINQPETLDILSDDHSLFQGLHNMIRDFSEGKLTNNLYKSSDFLGKSNRASMDYYNEQNKLKNKTLSMGIDNLAISVYKFKHAIKFIKGEVQKSANSIQKIAQLCSSNNINRQILKVTLECTRLIDLIIDTHKEEEKAIQLINNLLTIGSEAVQIINYIFSDPIVQKEMAEEINKLPTNEQQIQRQQGISYHPLFELFHIARKFQASYQFKVKQVIKIHLNYAQLCSTIIGQDNPLQLFEQQNSNHFYQSSQHTFVKNTLETFLRFQLQEWKKFEEDKMEVTIEYQASMYLALQMILKKFLFYHTKEYKETQLHNLIKQQLNEINSQTILEFLLTNLEVTLTDSFFEDIGQKQLSNDINMIGIKNNLFEQVRNCDKRKNHVTSLLVNLLDCWNILIDLYSIYDETFSNNLLLIKQLHQFFQEEQYFLQQVVSTYQQDINNYISNKVKLNFVHSILGLLNTISEPQSNCQDPPNFEDVEQQTFKQIYEDMKFKNYRQVLDRNLPQHSTIFTSALRLLSKPLLNHNLEQSITTIETEENQLLNKRIHYHHLIFQSLHTILNRLDKKCYLIEKQEILEFLIISLENNQSFMQYILKSQSTNQNSGIKYILELFQNILAYDDDLEQDYRIPMLVLIFLHQVLCINQSRYCSFAKECRTKFASLMLKLCREVQICLNKRCEKFIKFLSYNNSKWYITRETGTAIEQCVIENCVLDAIEELVMLEYFLKLLINEMKQEIKETTKAFGELIKLMFQKHFIREWYLLLIQFSDHVEFAKFQKRNPIIKSNIVFNYLSNYIYSYGRDFQIDSNTVNYTGGNAIAQQKSNIMASWFTQLLSTFNQLSQFVQFFFSIGLTGSPFSDNYQKDLYEDIELGDSIFSPNQGKEMIEGGVVKLFGQEENQYSETEYAFNAGLYFLQKGSQSIYGLDTSKIHEELMTPAIEVLNQICWYSQQVVNRYKFLHPFKDTTLMTNEKLNTMSKHQFVFFKRLLELKSVCNNDYKGKYKQILFSCFHSMLLVLQSVKETLLQEPQDLVQVFHYFILLIDFNDPNCKQQIGQLSSILSVILNIFPANPELLEKPNEGFYDIVNLQLEALKNQNNSQIFQSIIQCWIDIIIFNISNKIDVRYLKSLTFIADEQIYNSNENGQYNQKHSMWCHILVLVRELLAQDPTQCRQILEFLTTHEQRIHSAIIQIDQSQQYQSLRQFTAVTGLTLKHIQTYQQSYMLFFELSLITQFLLELILCKNMRLQFKLQLDKIIYTFMGQYSQQLGYQKKLKQFFQSFKPYTLLETKLNQLFAKPESIKTSDYFSIPQSAQLMKQNQTPSPHRTIQKDQTSNFDGKSTQGGGQKFNLKRDIDNISLFQYICLVEYLRFCRFSIQGIAASMNIFEVDRNFQLEDNVWNSFGNNIQNFIQFNFDAFANLSQSEYINNVIKMHQQLLGNYDFQIQYNGLQQLCVYPTNRDELLQMFIQNIIYGFCAELQYLQLREVHRKINFIKDSYNIEINLTKELSKYAETLKAIQFVKQMEAHDLLNEVLSFGEYPINEANDSYFNRWKVKFEEKCAEYKK
ncbi:unnamed protein product [Paramecium sonneborni]|uniref:Uncharacterized protein n=1 Tax=Paramecium sonneborni TaxID=65129 RepID=A0A8S1P3A2_9CILI|nr:unnamed protein product [Paramecium sonneborni]